METENDKQLAFLDVLVDNKNHDIVTSVFHKSTFTGLYTNFFSFTSYSYKIGLVRTLVDRCFKINNTWGGLHRDFERLAKDLVKNCFPRYLVERAFKDRVNQSLSYAPPPTPKSGNVRYFCIPYIGIYSKITQRKLKMLSLKYCKSNIMQLVFRSCKIGSLLNVKDTIPSALKSGVVYEFKCRCNLTYIGKTTRHLCTRIKEHLQSSKNSNINRHLELNDDCRAACGEHSFTIIDNDNNSYHLKLREAIQIQQRGPQLNGQLVHESLTLLI